MTMRTRATTLWERVGPRTRDVVFVAVTMLAALAQAVAPGDEGWPRAGFVLAIAVAGAIALWWRRQHPVAITIAGVVVLAATQLPLTMAIGLFSIAVRRRDRVLAVMTLAVAATFAIDYAIHTDGSWRNAIILGLIAAGFCAAAGAYVGARRDLVVSLRERAVRAEEERELRAEQATLRERARIAREMHDVLAHKVSLITLHAGALEVNSAADPEQIEETAALIRTTAREATEDLRDVLGVLRAGTDTDGADLAPQPQAPDIVRVVEASRAAGVHTELTMTDTPLPDVIARTAYRVVQEGLTNVHKHARGTATSVVVTGDERHGVTVEIINQRPVSSDTLLPGSGAGLVGLRERLAVLGGTLQCGPSADGGWRLTAWLPWHVGQAAAPTEVAT